MVGRLFIAACCQVFMPFVDIPPLLLQRCQPLRKGKFIKYSFGYLVLCPGGKFM